MSFTCKHCGHSYAKEKTLAAHMCEPKRRFTQRDEVGVQLGFKAYLRFYEVTQGSAKLKTYEDFSNSSYYLAFVRFGRYLCGIRAINPNSFTDWLLKNNKKLDHWCKDVLYSEWLLAYIRKEPVQDALERALKEMQDYADTDPGFENGFSDYFRRGNANRICHHVTSGRISPWIIYNCGSGIDFLEALTPEQTSIVLPFIDPDAWQVKFKDYAADVEWCKNLLEQAGL